MRAVVFFSGGISSYCAARFAVGKYGAENVTLLFTDTKTEDEDLYRFIRQAAMVLGARFEWITEGRDVWQVFNDKRFVGNTRRDPCSEMLKRNPARRWIKKHAPDAVLVFGIDEFEAHRAEKISKRYAPMKVEYPMIENILGHDEKRRMVESDGLKIPRLYDMGFAHNNCGGFCIKAGQGHFANLYKTMPERYAYHAEQERKIIARGINHKGIIRKNENKVKKYLTLDAFAKLIEAGEYDKNDVRGCGCFAV